MKIFLNNKDKDIESTKEKKKSKLKMVNSLSSVLDIFLAIFSIILPLVGGAITVIMFYYRDVMEKEPRRLVVNIFLWGLLTGLIIIAFTIPMFMLANRAINQLTENWQIILVMLSIILVQVLVEEGLKGIVLWRRCFRVIGEIDGLFDGFFYGAIIGTGAGVVDAVAYSILATDWLSGFEIAIIRTIRIPGTHALFTGIIGMYFAWHKFKNKKIYPGVIYAVLLHTIWNIITYIISFYLVGIPFYGTNFALLGIYLTLMFVLSVVLVKYDRKNFPEGSKILLKERVEKQETI